MLALQYQLSSQPRSRLLTLPPDIRLEIWRLVLSGYKIALFRGHRRLHHALIDEDEERDFQLELEYGNRMPNYYHHPRMKLSSFPLLRTCRFV